MPKKKETQFQRQIRLKKQDPQCEVHTYIMADGNCTCDEYRKKHALVKPTARSIFKES